MKNVFFKEFFLLCVWDGSCLVNVVVMKGRWEKGEYVGNYIKKMGEEDEGGIFNFEGRCDSDLEYNVYILLIRFSS